MSVEEAPSIEPVGSLSPSRASDFLRCPLLFRFRTIDRLPEPTTREAARGTLVHRVLETLFDLPPAERTPERASAMIEPAWVELEAEHDDLRALFEPATVAAVGTPESAEPVAADELEDRETWLASCRAVLARYFALEDPTRLEPAGRELYVEALLDSRLVVRGVVDRLDEAPDGALRIVDYKTGKAPREGFEAKALFQLRMYALALWRERQVVPAMLQLVYLGSGEVIRYVPDEHDLRATERKVDAVWTAIRRGHETGDWQPSRSALCSWCAHRAICPEFGGTPPPLPPRRERREPTEGGEPTEAAQP